MGKRRKIGRKGVCGRPSTAAAAAAAAAAATAEARSRGAPSRPSFLLLLLARHLGRRRWCLRSPRVRSSQGRLEENRALGVPHRERRGTPERRAKHFRHHGFELAHIKRGRPVYRNQEVFLDG